MFFNPVSHHTHPVCVCVSVFLSFPLPFTVPSSSSNFLLPFLFSASECDFFYNHWTINKGEKNGGEECKTMPDNKN